MDLLLPCPFCGSEAKFHNGNEHSYIGGYDISITLECESCPATMETSYGKNFRGETTLDGAKESLISSWNNRK
jgi:Lar family restriction alleviation protein